MKNKIFTFIWYSVVLLAVASFFSFKYLSTDNFEGMISYEKISMTDTVKLDYYIKDHKVRINKTDKNGKITEFTIIDFDENTYTVLNPRLKKFVTKELHPKDAVVDEQISVTKTQNYKYLQGYKCYQWLVRSKKYNTVVVFWVADEHYNLYDDLLKSLDDTEKISGYYAHIQQADGYIPLQSIERSWLRDPRMELTAKKIKKTALKDYYFTIPKNYQAFE